jgi:hypothetical protein
MINRKICSMFFLKLTSHKPFRGGEKTMMLLPPQNTIIPRCTQCGGERGWFLHKHPVTKKIEIRACDLCDIYNSDQQAGEFASFEIVQAIELADNITKVRATDKRIKRATVKAFNERSSYQRREGH